MIGLNPITKSCPNIMSAYSQYCSRATGCTLDVVHRIKKFSLILYDRCAKCNKVWLVCLDRVDDRFRRRRLPEKSNVPAFSLEVISYATDGNIVQISFKAGTQRFQSVRFFVVDLGLEESQRFLHGVRGDVFDRWKLFLRAIRPRFR